MADEKDKFPKVEGGGSLMIAWQIRNKHVLVVGGGEVCPAICHYHHCYYYDYCYDILFLPTQTRHFFLPYMC